MKKLSHLDGSWAELLSDWSSMCHELGEDFQSFTPETMGLLAQLVEETESSQRDGVYGLKGDDGTYSAVCFVNPAYIPNFTGRVLRVRHILLSPRSDFGEFDAEWHGTVLGTVFERILEISDDRLICPHVKLHFRSPADLALFARTKDEILKSNHFSDVKLIGAWLILTKA